MAQKDSMEVDEVENKPAEVPEESGSDVEEEYEIEVILDARKGAFPQVMSLARVSRCVALCSPFFLFFIVLSGKNRVLC